MNVVHLCRAVLAAAILVGMSLQPTGAADAVSFRLDWTLSGYHLPFYWAKDKGYYGAENLDVDIKEGAGSGKTVALMSGQQDDIGLADYMFMSVGVAKGMKLKGIFGEVQDGAWAVISRADSPIKKPEDLIGCSVATTADHKAMLDLLLAINKIPADKVKIQVTSAATRNTFCERPGRQLHQRPDRFAARSRGARAAGQGQTGLFHAVRRLWHRPDGAGPAGA